MKSITEFGNGDQQTWGRAKTYYELDELYNTSLNYCEDCSEEIEKEFDLCEECAEKRWEENQGTKKAN